MLNKTKIMKNINKEQINFEGQSLKTKEPENLESKLKTESKSLKDEEESKEVPR